MPSPVCLTLAPTMYMEPAPYQRVMHPHQFECRNVAEAARHFGRAHDVGEHDGAQPGIDFRLAAAGGGARIADAAEERLDGGKIDQDDGIGDLPMRLAMDVLGGRGIGCIDQTESGSALVVTPVGNVFDPEFSLNFHVLVVRTGDIFLSRLLKVPAGYSGSPETGYWDRISS
jgi:hypothetical protein